MARMGILNTRNVLGQMWLARGELCRSISSAGSTAAPSPFSLRSHTCGELRRDHVGESVSIYGWLGKPRLIPTQGVAFLPVHDTTGTIQFVCKLSEWQNLLESFSGKERVVKVGGVVKPRPPEAVNTNQPTGEVEVEVTSLEVINEATHSPFSTFGGYLAEKRVSLEQQLRERPHYLRLPHMQRNLRLRSDVAMTVREFLVRCHGFLEVETPTLFRRTPEGAQEFVVPTRTPGKFFSLVQSPQQFKQLLMVAGVERYFQFARCYRDEDQRSDRQPEFTQIDLEMAFVNMDCVMQLTEQLVSHTISSVCPELSIPDTPFPRMEYRHAMERYGSDKPDTRYGLHLENLSSVWAELLGEMGMEREKEEEGTLLNPHVFALKIPGWVFAIEEAGNRDRTKVKETATRIKELLKTNTMAMITPDDAKTFESLDSLLSIHFPVALRSLFSHLSPSLEERLAEKISQRVKLDKGNGDICVIVTAEEENKDKMLATLGAWRNVAANILHLTERIELDSTQLDFLWVVDFPLFSVDQQGGVFRITSTHHPFTAPRDEDREKLLGRWTPEELTQVRGQHYDLVVNGVELGGGSIRVHDPNLQEHIFNNILKVSSEPFSHLLKGLRSGCPPHGGIALGFDRLMAVLCQAQGIRDVIAFPKSFHSRDLLTGAPSDLSPRQLSQYHLRPYYDDYSSDND